LLDPASKAVVLTTGSAGSPWSIPATLAELEHVVRQHDHLAVSFFLETRLDPAREVEAWLAQRVFRVNERWFGPVRLVEYAGSGATFDVLPVEARFGDAIRLEAVDVFDAAVSAGGRLRLRLHWLAEGRVDRNYQVFVHLFDQTGIAAQHDGQPVAELRPTTTWQPGETILDQFAIAVPEAIPPGVYQLRIGLYDAGSLARLPVRLADGGQAEFFVGGEITIR
jgi:hypothetical protein